MSYVIETRDLTIRFGDFVAVNKVNLKIEAGKIFGFLGPNGSGKSTTIRMLCGILTPTSGSCCILNKNVAEAADEIKQNIGYMSQKFSLYADLTVQENLEFYAGMYNVEKAARAERIKEMLIMSGLTEQRDVLTADLSAGVRQRLALGCAILHRPEILFLDEPTSGVDPKSRRLFWKVIYQLAGAGTTILITTHFMDEAEHCDEVGFINAGRLVASGSPAALKSSIRGALLNIPCDDSVKLLADIKSRDINFFDAYNYGKNLRILVDEKYLKDFAEWNYQVVPPSMEDVFAYYVRLQREYKI